MAEADVGVKMALRTTSRWNALTLPTQGAEDVMSIDTMRAVQLLTTASDNLTRLIAGGSAPAATTAPELPTPEPEYDTRPIADGRIISKIAAVHHKLRRFLSEKEVLHGKLGKQTRAWRSTKKLHAEGA